MAKNKIKIKNMKLEQNELASTTIGVFENRKKSSFGVFILLTLFILVVFFLPEISDKVNEYLHPKTPDKPAVTPGGNKKPDVPDGENYNNQFYELAEGLKIVRDDITVGDLALNLENNTLNFSITNNTNQYLVIETLNYYLELYTEDHTLLERIRLTEQRDLNSGAFYSYVKNIKASTAESVKAFTLVKKTINDYPLITLNPKEDGSTTLVCSNSHETVTYKFVNDALKNVVSEANYLNTELDYETNYTINKENSLMYNNRDGVVSIFMDYEAGYKITTNIDSANAERFYVFGADSFKLDDPAKVVNFEMEAQGYDCN